MLSQVHALLRMFVKMEELARTTKTWSATTVIVRTVTQATTVNLVGTCSFINPSSAELFCINHGDQSVFYI